MAEQITGWWLRVVVTSSLSWKWDLSTKETRAQTRLQTPTQTNSKVAPRHHISAHCPARMQRPSLKRGRSALDDVSDDSLDAVLNVDKRPTSPSKSSIAPGAKRRLPIVEGVLSPMKPQFAHALYTLMERRPSASPVRQNLFQSLTAAVTSASELPILHASPLRKRPRIERTLHPSPEPFQTPRKSYRRDTTNRIPALKERELYECLERAPLPPVTPSVRWLSESPVATPVPQTPTAFLIEPEGDDSEDDNDPGFTIWSDPLHETPTSPPPKPQVVLDDEDPNEEDKENQKPAFPKVRYPVVLSRLRHL
jgi:hypothetical protein